MPALGQTRIMMWEGACLWMAQADRGFDQPGWHAHHAIQLTFLLRGELEMRTEAEVLRASAIAVNADVRHSLAARGAAAVLFLEPESSIGAALQRKLFAERDFVVVSSLPVEAELSALASAMDAKASREDLALLGKALLSAISGEGESVIEKDARILKVIEAVITRLDGPMSIEEAGRGINLSASRLRHLFAEQTGLPFKTYLLWRRMMQAVELMAEGASPTEAAHGAGFSDSAHFARTFRRTFGMSSTTLKVV